jgi:hypothetical protein
MPDPRDLKVYQLLFNIASALVDHPGEIIIRMTLMDDGAKFTLRVHPEDIGILIGKKGRAARSIRTIILGVAAKHERRYVIVIDDEPTEDASAESYD